MLYGLSFRCCCQCRRTPPGFSSLVTACSQWPLEKMNSRSALYANQQFRWVMELSHSTSGLGLGRSPNWKGTARIRLRSAVMGSAAQRASLPTILIVEDEFLPRAMLSDHLQENVSLIGGSSATYRVSVWISQLGFGAWANELLGNNRLGGPQIWPCSHHYLGYCRHDDCTYSGELSQCSLSTWY